MVALGCLIFIFLIFWHKSVIIRFVLIHLILCENEKKEPHIYLKELFCRYNDIIMAEIIHIRHVPDLNYCHRS